MSAVITLIVILALSTVLTNGQETSVDSNQILRTKRMLNVTMQSLELDFRNLGSGKLDVETSLVAGAIDTLSCYDSKGSECRFTFWSKIDPNNADTNLVEYVWSWYGDEVIDTDLSASSDNLVSVPMLRVRRVVDGNTMLELDRVRKFEVNTFDNDGNPSVNIPNVRQIEVRLASLIPTTQTDEAMEEVAWSTFFRPANLTRAD